MRPSKPYNTLESSSPEEDVGLVLGKPFPSSKISGNEILPALYKKIGIGKYQIFLIISFGLTAVLETILIDNMTSHTNSKGNKISDFSTRTMLMYAALSFGSILPLIVDIKTSEKNKITLGYTVLISSFVLSSVFYGLPLLSYCFSLVATAVVGGIFTI